MANRTQGAALAVAVGLALAAGGGRQAPGFGGAVPAPELLLSRTSVVAGETVDLTVSGLDEGDEVGFGVSLAGPGSGPCPAALEGPCSSHSGKTRSLRS